jgi:hypothetical protein
LQHDRVGVRHAGTPLSSPCRALGTHLGRLPECCSLRQCRGRLLPVRPDSAPLGSGIAQQTQCLPYPRARGELLNCRADTLNRRGTAPDLSRGPTHLLCICAKAQHTRASVNIRGPISATHRAPGSAGAMKTPMGYCDSTTRREWISQLLAKLNWMLWPGNQIPDRERRCSGKPQRIF